MNTEFKQKYGPWALIAGGSEGIGGAYADEIAKNGINVVLIARRSELLNSKAKVLTETYGVVVKTIRMDLAETNMLQEITARTHDLEIGLLVYNAASASVGSFFDSTLQDEEMRLNVNCRGPLNLVYWFGKKMIERKRGGIILMSSQSGLRGGPFYSHYAATKAYNIVLAESLWYEFRPYNVDVLACIAGLTSSPELMKTVDQGKAKGEYFMTPEEVAREAMKALGKQPSIISGEKNRSIQEYMSSVPRQQAIELVAKHAIKNFLDGNVPDQYK